MEFCLALALALAATSASTAAATAAVMRFVRFVQADTYLHTYVTLRYVLTHTLT